MRLRSSHAISITQSLFGVCLLACLLLVPHYFFSLNQGGISNYGTEERTKWLYILGFGFAAMGCLVAGLGLPRQTTRRTSVQLMLFLLSVLYAAVLLSTFDYKLSASAKHLHEQSAIALFIVMLLSSLWLRFKAVKDPWFNLAFVIFCLGFGLSVVTFLGGLHLLFTAQISCGAAFAYMLARSIGILTDQQKNR